MQHTGTSHSRSLGSSKESADQLADATGSLDTGFGLLGELLGPDNAGHAGDLSGSENLEEALELLFIL